MYEVTPFPIRKKSGSTNKKKEIIYKDSFIRWLIFSGFSVKNDTIIGRENEKLSQNFIGQKNIMYVQ